MHLIFKTKNHLVGIIFLMLLGASPLLAQSGVTVSGTIKDQNDAVVQGATVRLLNLGNSQETTSTTDSTGKYEFTNVASGSYRLSATGSGFATVAESLTIVGDNLTQDFSLAPGGIQDVVTVTAGKGNVRIATEVPQIVTVTTQQQIEQQRPRSTFEAIERTPNIIVRETNPARERPRLRGLDSSRLLIVVDGERLNNSRTDLNTGLSPSIIDVTQLESAEVVSGSGASLYGSDALAGTINLITKGPDRPNQGVNMGFRLDGNYSSNGEIVRGSGVFNISNKFAAFRASYSQFSLTNYSTGNEDVSIQDVINIGEFYKSFPTGAVGPTRQAASSFPIFALPAGSEVLGGGGRGYNAQADVWFFPVDNHSFRGRYLGSQHKDLGDAFSGPPYETQERFNAFRNFDKFSLRYEGLDIFNWLPRVSVNYYHQKLSFPQSQFEYTNLAGGSFVGNNFTGNPSQFRITTFTDNKNTIDSDGFDAQANFQPFAGLIVTVGGGTLIDNSTDEFTRFSVNSASPTRDPLPNSPTTPVIVGGASSPNTKYTDNNFYLLGEFDRIRWLRLTGSIRVDNWKSKATPSDNFPLGSEFAVLQASIPALTVNPNPLQSQLAALPTLVDLAARRGEVETDNVITTGGFGVVFRLPYGFNPYFRFATGYREGSLTERYLIRNFPAFPGLVAIVVGNPNIDPEKNRSYDVGVKFQQKYFTGSFGYFRNELEDLIRFQTPDVGNLCVAPNPSAGLLPLNPVFAPLAGCAVGQSAISFNGRTNLAEATISGFEGIGEVSIPLGNFGSLNPFGSFGTLKGVNKSPSGLQTRIIREIYNRPNAANIPLSGSEDNVPLGNITPFRLIGGVQYIDSKGRFTAEYNFRHQSRVERADPASFVGTTLINFGTFASLNGFTRHNLRAGYSWRSERYRFSLNAGIDNLTDKLYWEQFQNAPAPGRSFVFGFTTEFFNLFGNK
jgi:outer membrane receptor protein involved in Fe transport